MNQQELKAKILSLPKEEQEKLIRKAAAIKVLPKEAQKYLHETIEQKLAEYSEPINSINKDAEQSETEPSQSEPSKQPT